MKNNLQCFSVRSASEDDVLRAAEGNILLSEELVGKTGEQVGENVETK